MESNASGMTTRNMSLTHCKSSILYLSHPRYQVLWLNTEMRLPSATTTFVHFSVYHKNNQTLSAEWQNNCNTNCISMTHPITWWDGAVYKRTRYAPEKNKVHPTGHKNIFILCVSSRPHDAHSAKLNDIKTWRPYWKHNEKNKFSWLCSISGEGFHHLPRKWHGANGPKWRFVPFWKHHKIKSWRGLVPLQRQRGSPNNRALQTSLISSNLSWPLKWRLNLGRYMIIATCESLKTPLEDIGHLHSNTLVQINNSTTHTLITNKIFSKALKVMNMLFYWFHNQDYHNFWYYWILGKK